MTSRGLTKKELEDLRKKEEEEAAAHVFKEFVETFQEAPSTTSRVWVKAGTYDAGARKEDTSERGKIYKPVSRIDEKRPSAEDVIRSLVPRGDTPVRPRGGKPSKDKKKSNLELFKEELRQIQEERSERHKYKTVLRTRGSAPDPMLDLMPDMGSYDTGDPNTTNLYLGNLNPKITEQQLMEIFGRYGPLASIKIMWPRSDEEKARGRNCGFVAYMSRKDGERALRCINGKEILNYEMKLGWGKAVVIPPVPIYIPPALQQPSRPPPPSGLPFNAQPPRHVRGKIPQVPPGEYYPIEPDEKREYEEILSQSIVKIVVPTERNILMLIHRLIEFVIREGPMFEAIIMNKELNNPFFGFLFENQSPAHVYYRWKLFSMLQGDSPKQWNTDDFRMFKGGSVWRPPVMNLYTAGMPDELVEEDEARDGLRGSLSNTQRDRLEELIRGLLPSRTSVGEAMAWCLEHADAANEVAQCILESMSNEDTAIHKKIARLYLISDILHNAGVKLSNASAYRAAFQQRLVSIFTQCGLASARVPARLQRAGFRARVTRVLQAWAGDALYAGDTLASLHDAFRAADEPDGATDGSPTPARAESGAASPASSASSGSWNGALDGAALRRRLATAAPVEENIDGVPLDIDGVPLEGDSSPPASPSGPPPPPVAGFVPSKWESVEFGRTSPAPVASTPPPMDVMETDGGDFGPPPSIDLTVPPAPSPATGEALLPRGVLRDIEVRVLRYTDELESGARRRRQPHAASAAHFRRKLIKKALKEMRDSVAAEVRESPERKRSPIEEDDYSISSKKSKKSREPSLSPPPKRSRHSDRKTRSRSKSREREREKERDRSREKERERERERERDRERERERDRERERERRRRSPATPPSSHHHRKHSKHSKYR